MRQGSEYQTQLREKQKARRIYGLLEKQFRNLYDEANRQSGITGENLLRMLELRLDNVAYRANWASSRNQSRQLVTHGHIQVNGRRVSIASYRVRPGDVVSLSPAARENVSVHQNLDLIDRAIPGWLETQEDGQAVIVRVVPQREQIDTQVREQLIVELYSK
jgi:small subunit ribosomal protein S4